MKKSDLRFGLIAAALGAVLFTLAIIWETRLSGMMAGLGGACIGPSLISLWKYWKWTRPENADAYREKLEQEQIALRDERKSMLRDKSGRYAYLFSMVLCSAAIVVFGMLGALEAVDFARPAVLLLAAYLVVQYAAGVYFYHRLEEKY